MEKKEHKFWNLISADFKFPFFNLHGDKESRLDSFVTCFISLYTHLLFSKMARGILIHICLVFGEKREEKVEGG